MNHLRRRSLSGARVALPALTFSLAYGTGALLTYLVLMLLGFSGRT